MKKILTTLLILLIFTPISFGIIEEKKINLQDAIEIALKTNPQIKISKLNAMISKNEIKSSAALKNPSINAFENIGKGLTGNPQTVGINYEIELFKREKRKNYYSSKYKEVQNDEIASKNDLLFAIKETYVLFLLKKSNLKIYSEQKYLAQKLYEEVLKSTEKGNIPKEEIIQAKISLNKAKMMESNAQWEVIYAQNQFNNIMNTSEINYDTKEEGLNDDYKTLLTVNPNDNNINFEQIKEYALNHRPDILKAKQKVISAQNNLKAVKSKLIPNLEIEGGWGYLTKNNTNNGYFQSGAYVGAKLTDIPIVNQYKPEINSAQLEIEKANLEYEDVRIDAIRSITDTWEKYTIAKDTLLFFQNELLNDSKELEKSAKNSLDNNKIDLTSYLVSKKLYLDLMLGYQDALATYYISYAELLREINFESWELL